MATQTQQQFGTDASGIDPELRLGVEALQAQLGGALVLLGFHRGEDRFHGYFSHPRQCQALTQLVGAMRLEQIAIQGRFGRLRNVGVGGFARHHDEYRGKGQQLVAPQVVQHVLPSGTVALKVQLAQHHVEVSVLEVAARVGHPRTLRDVANAEIAQLIHQNRA